MSQPIQNRNCKGCLLRSKRTRPIQPNMRSSTGNLSRLSRDGNLVPERFVDIAHVQRNVSLNGRSMENRRSARMPELSRWTFFCSLSPDYHLAFARVKIFAALFLQSWEYFACKARHRFHDCFLHAEKRVSVVSIHDKQLRCANGIKNRLAIWLSFQARLTSR